jgi:hypothetical protein
MSPGPVDGARPVPGAPHQDQPEVQLFADLRAGDFFAADFVVDLVVDLAAEDFFAVDLAADDDFFAVDLAAVDFVAGDFFASVLAAADLAADDEDLLAMVLAAGALVAAFVPLERVVDLAAVDLVVLEEAVVVARAAATFGSFLAPLTTSLKPCPARNPGRSVFFFLTGAPVRGFLWVRADTGRFSKVPNPVIWTLSPLDTARVTTSMKPLTASLAAILFPSRCVDRASISSDLFTCPSQDVPRPVRPSRAER